jgi:malonate decarboxylase gamma subunit
MHWLAETVLASTAAHPQRPIVMLVDTAASAWRGATNCWASMATGASGADARPGTPPWCAPDHPGLRRIGQRRLLSFGLMADHIHALPDAQVRVMDLRAMARVTKQPLEKLQALSQSSPVFAPGVANYVAMGAVESLWDGDLAQHLLQALRTPRRRPACRTRRTAWRSRAGGRGFDCGGPRRCLSGPPATRWPGCRPTPTGGPTCRAEPRLAAVRAGPAGHGGAACRG